MLKACLYKLKCKYVANAIYATLIGTMTAELDPTHTQQNINVIKLICEEMHTCWKN